MSEAIPPSGAPGAHGASSNPTDQDSQSPPRQLFPTMPFSAEQYKQFMKNEFKILSQIIKHDMQRMKKAMEEMKRAAEGN
ncbi:MAG: hypothetical protein H7A39_02130 [Chlamydiales bacterium]|nr:hypothetical protein [Chlamydiales bacterium]